MTSKERARLKGLASTADTIVQIGKSGITENVVASVDAALTARELVKGKVLESSMLTLLDLERELNWIKSTDRPYLTIETAVNEITDRKNVIFESVKDLINL